MRIIIDDLNSQAIASLLDQHLQDMHLTSPKESIHALDIAKLKQPSITFYSAWRGEQLLGCAAIKHHTKQLVELKSMRTSEDAREQGVASSLLQHIITVARAKEYQYLSLETGSQRFFKAAHSLYQKFGFEDCAPFAHYKLDPNSIFMTLALQPLSECIQ